MAKSGRPRILSAEQQVAAASAHKLPPFPSVRKLADEYGVSKTTMAVAIKTAPLTDWVVSPKAAWFVEVATNIGDAQLEWRQAQVGGVVYAFVEADRERADNIAIELADMLGDGAVVRVRHKLREKRGVFLPRPLPARRIHINSGSQS